MGTLVLATFLTVDGVMQAPGGPDEDTTGGFRHGGWLAPAFADPDFGPLLGEGLGSMAALLLGRRTYDIFAATWPGRPADDPVTALMNSVPKYVASTTLTDPTWQNTTVLGADTAEEVARLKQSIDGEIVIQGSSVLAQSMIGQDLVDQFRLLLAPVVVGSGRPLFGTAENPVTLELDRVRTTSAGFVMLEYTRAGRRS